MLLKTRVVIVDDHPLFREGVAAILANDSDFEVVGQGSTADDAVKLVHELLPDLIMMDIDIPGSGLAAAQTISEQCPVTCILFLTVSENVDHLISALKTGARAYILKGVAGRELVRILKEVHSGESYLPSGLAASLLIEMSSPRPVINKHHSPLDELTEREREIMEKLAAGLSNKEIGLKLHLSEKTVKHYMTNILQKLRVRNRVEAALIAQRQGDKIRQLA
jgi:two-component system, NarL family, nitrate/nitrite response regulator NarL